MRIRAAVAVASCAALCVACAERAGEQDPIVEAPPGPTDLELEQRFEWWLRREQPWQERDGSMICSGFLSRVESDEFCSDERPPDWRPFDYRGQTYFVQPLAGVGVDRAARSYPAR